MEYLVLFVTALLVLDFSRCSMSPECEAWDNIKRSLKKEQVAFSCLVYDDCTGLNCSGNFFGEESKIGLQLHHCEVPTTISLFADAPQLGIHTWKGIFAHNESFQLAGEIHGKLNFRKQKNNIAIDLKLKFLPVVEKYLPPSLGATTEYTVLKDVLIPLPLCESSETANVATVVPTNTTASMLHNTVTKDTERNIGNCSIYNSSCGPLEICKQLNETHDDGICVCLPLYIRHDTGDCMFSNGTITTTEAAPNNGQIPNTQSDSSSNKFLLEVILLPICVVILTIALIYMTVRFHLFRKLRNHFRVQVYDHVLLGRQDDNDEPLTDPVA